MKHLYRRRISLLSLASMAVIFLVIATWAGGVAQAQTAPVGQGFNLNASDLRFIMQQIRISERHASTQTPANPCQTLIGGHPDQIPLGTGQTIELPWGLRTVDGSCNHLTPGQETFGTADQLFPRLLLPEFSDAEGGTSYSVSGNVTDSQPRTISNLVVDQTNRNPSAVSVSGLTGLPGESLFIPNVAPDAGLSAPFNSWFTFFGQFFDHGLDLVKKGGTGTVFIPLQADDPLFVVGSPTNFMVLTRATHNGNFEAINNTSPWVDQSQTYASHPSHQVFLRSYTLVAGRPVGNGRLITGQNGGMATWADLKAQALNVLGIQLADTDVLNGPLLATDPYGRFLRGPLRGLPQIVKSIGGVITLVEGNLAIPVDTVSAVPSGHAFLDDIAHIAAPGSGRIPDADTVAGTDDGFPGTYDNELLDAHFMAGDGRVNENIALTAVHHVFHSEHNRLTGVIANMIATDPAFTQAERDAWQLATNGPAGWDYGERLFQAARFVTEMEYQHLVFEEFARKVQPLINPFGGGGTGFNPSVNAAIRAEFAHAVYRFGHSMLTESVDRFRADGTPDHITLFDAFLNPLAFNAGYATPEEAAGAIVRGATRQIGNEIDEFVIEAVRNRLLGLPLDLATLNITRARETGIPPLNEVRAQFFLATQNSVLAPHADWIDFGLSIRNSSSWVNFIAAYGTHPTITGTMAQRRAAAQAILNFDPLVPDASDFLTSVGAYAPDPLTGRTTTGVDDIDLWVGGLAEKPAVFGGLLGPTFNYVFETQLEDLQDGDRFYYLSRTAGLNLLVQLEGNSLAELIQRNTDASGLPADAFSRPTYIFYMAAQTNPTGIVDDPATPDYDERLLLIRRPDGTIRYTGIEHVVFDGSAGNDRMWSSEGDDTMRGNDGNDWIDGGDGNDSLIGGLGDDILFGGFGDDVLKGGDGNDVLSSGQGFGGDLNQGGLGNDYIVGGNDLTTSFGGPGNDFIFAGDGDDTVFGDDGDDWIEGGRGAFNLLQGDNGAPFQNDPNAPGHDVIIGFGGEQDYDMEGGDDIGFMGPGIQRVEGMLGFDWATHKLDPNPGDSDMFFTALLPPTVNNNRDRFDLVEGLSGGPLNDILKGDNRTAAIIAPDHVLNAAGIARIQGLAALLPVGATSFSSGNIILGGAGSDILEGRGGDDILDGDAWLDAQIRVTGVRPIGIAEFHDTMATLNTAVIAGQINPGQLVIVRSIKVAAANPTHIDTAVFSGPRADYDIVNNVDGSITVTHARGTAADGTDTLRNIEALQFADRTISFVLRTVASGDAATANGAAPVIIDVLANDTFDGLAIPAGATVTLVTNAVDGNAVLNANNTFTFTANAGFIGIATFTYNVTVSGQLSNTATVTVTVNPAVPVANADTATTTGTTPVNINVLANDTYDGGAIPAGATVTRVANSANGNAVLNADNTFTFTANAGFSGITTFTYNVTVGGQVSNTATVTVTVNPANLIANADAATTTGTAPVNINVLANDTYNGGAIPAGATVTRVANSANGNAVLNADNTFTFTANTLFSGLTTFTYNVTVLGQVSNTATVTVTVNPAIPVANADAATTAGTAPVNINVLANDTYNGGAIPAGATVTRVANSANGNAVLNADNTFTFTANAGFSGITTFTYNVTVGGQVSNTATVTVTVIPTFSISGRVARANGNAVSGVTMALSGAATGTTTTDVNGNYTFTGLLNGSYTVTPSLAGFAFAPVNRAVVINNANVAAQNFTALPAIFSISGTVRTAGGGLGGGTPVAGVTMTLTGAATRTTTTNALGVYTFSALADGSYTVTPTLAGSTFTPVSRTVVINNANVVSQDFTRTAAAATTFSISGTITIGGLPLSGVSVALTGAATANTTTNAAGVYTFTGLANGNYTVTPSFAGFTFAPVNRAVVINNANVTGQNFTGTAVVTTFSISGTITNGGLPMSGVSVALTGAATANTTTNAAGVYTFTGLANGNYTVTPSLAGFTFAPVNRAVVINNANVTGQNFTGTAVVTTFSISGTVRTAGGGGVGGGGGTPVAGVTITLSGAASASVTTNALGVYTFTGLTNGNYTVTPSLAGFTFTPVSRAVTINNSNVTGRDFTRN